MTTAICAMPGGRQVGLVVEDAAEVLAIREDVGLQRQERAAGVDQVDARQPVLGGDLLQPEVLLDRHREVGAALDGGVVGDDGDLATADDADAGDDPRARRLAVVHVPGRERRELEERRPGIDEPVDAVAGQQLAAPGVPRDGLVAAALADERQPIAQLGDEREVRVAVGVERGGPRRVGEDGHRAISIGHPPRVKGTAASRRRRTTPVAGPAPPRATARSGRHRRGAVRRGC